MKKRLGVFLKQSLLLALGSTLCAIAVKGILLPHDFLAGGLTGVSLLIYYKYPVLSVGIIYLIINIPVFISGWCFVGRRFIIYSLWGMVIYSLMLYFIDFRIVLHDRMLSAVIAGVISGSGAALILRSYGSGGGIDILRVIMFKLFAVSLGTGSIIVNTAVLIGSTFFFPVENVLFTLVYILVNTQVTDRVFHGFAERQTALIISNRWEAIAEELKKYRFGMTLIKGTGGYKRKAETILLTVINRKNIPLLKKTVLHEDPDAFIALMTAEDVTGIEIGNQPHW